MQSRACCSPHFSQAFESSAQVDCISKVDVMHAALPVDALANDLHSAISRSPNLAHIWVLETHYSRILCRTF